MKYTEPFVVTKATAEADLDSGDGERIREALIALSLNEPDWRWVQSICLRFVSSSDASIRAVCATCFGHLARLHGQLDLVRVLPVLKNLLKDPQTENYAKTALDDVRMFVGAELVDRMWGESS